MRKSLNIISKNKKNFHIKHSDELLKNIRFSSPMLYSADDNSEEDDATKGTVDNSKSDSDSLTYQMNVYIQNLLDLLGQPQSITFNDSSVMYSNDITSEINGSDEPVNQAEDAVAWDPRLYRRDGFVTQEHYIVPFATETASSAYYDHLFTIEYGVIKEAPTSSLKDEIAKANQNDNKSGQFDDKAQEYQANGSPTAGDKIAPNKAQVNELRADPNMYGTASLINPYCVTRLMGGIRGTEGNHSTHMYDIRDNKRFYDTSGVEGGSLVDIADDYTSINNPTTTNIITWSNKDKWNRTPYSFLDFVFCKYWNVIPNNHLITFRKYSVPTYDNLNFPLMNGKDGKTTSSIQVSPIATVVSYFGGESGNKLNDFLKFTTGTKWKNIEADVHKVTGDTGSNPRAVIDQMFESGGWGGVSSRSTIVNSFLSKVGGLCGSSLSLGKFVGLLDSDGYSGHSQKAWENLTSANVDPSEQLYSNKIVGPVNRIQSVLAREAGIEFEQSFNLTCEYVARPVANVNTKAAMLDILANCMEIASVEAVFWGGGYRFMIKPHMYPFKREGTTNRMMDALYAGNIFGNKGAIAEGLRGLAEFGKNENGDFSWSNVTSKLGTILSLTVGAIGNMLTSISSALFGELANLTEWLKAGTDAVSSKENQQAGTKKLNNLAQNLNHMWKDKVIQETTMPNIEGMKAILSGEPTGNYWIEIGNPLNPIMVVGNLICKKMTVEFGEELGPDDFPLEMKVVYTIEHGMARDKAAIQSMFNRGAGKIYKLPDYIRAVSDYETKVDPFTGVDISKRIDLNSFYVPKYMNASALMAKGGAKGYQTYKITKGKQLATSGNSKTTMITKFTPVDPLVSSPLSKSSFLSDVNNVATFNGNFYTRKRNDN